MYTENLRILVIVKNPGGIQSAYPKGCKPLWEEESLKIKTKHGTNGAALGLSYWVSGCTPCPYSKS